MLIFAILLLVVSSEVFASTRNTDKSCGDYQANFDMKSVIGAWHVVGILPGPLFPDKEVSCYKVEFSETDEAGLRWLVNRTSDSSQATRDIRGTIIRQRYHLEHDLDVWSKAVEGVNGCFQQVLSMDTESNDIHRGLIEEATMQLHLLENSSDPMLLQLLWGDMVTAVIYWKHKGAVEIPEQLRPALELVEQLRGQQSNLRICSKQYREKLNFD